MERPDSSLADAIIPDHIIQIKSAAAHPPDPDTYALLLAHRTVRNNIFSQDRFTDPVIFRLANADQEFQSSSS